VMTHAGVEPAITAVKGQWLNQFA